VRLAEEVALLDMLSGGRVNWGAGRGFAPSEFDAEKITKTCLGVRSTRAPIASARPSRSCCSPVAGALQAPRKHFKFDDIEVLPKPLQRPLPVWMAATSESAIDWAAVAALDSDGPARLDPGAGRQEPPLRREDGRFSFSMKAATFQWPA